MIQNLLDLQQESFPKQSIDWMQVVEKLAEERRACEETFRFLVKCSVTKRINAIGLKQLRDSVTYDIKTV